MIFNTILHIFLIMYEGHSINKQNNFFIYRIFFHKCKLCVVWKWFIAKIILIPKKDLF